MRHVFRTSMHLPFAQEDVFAFFARAENLERITPPELRFEITSERPVRIGQGARIAYRLRLFGIPFVWQTLISQWDPPHAFVDEQLRGPYREWVHVHRFRAEPGGTAIDDEVWYRLPFFPLGELAYPVVRLQLKRIFAYRHRRIRAAFELGDGDG